MKRAVLAIAVIIGISLAQVNAQNDIPNAAKITGGLKAETNLSNFILSGMSDAKSKMNFGATFGGFLNLDVSKYFAIQGELLYHYKSSDLVRNGIKSEYQYWGIEIPIYAMFQWKTNENRRAYIGIGPYTEFGFSAKMRRDGETIDLYEKDKSAMLDSNSGFGVIVGYEFARRIQINAGYKISITNILDGNSSSVTLLPAAISLGIGYRFGK
ncbi:MAG: PorT family protein [Candidatus Symbiothrix sp.]|jgi:hypothetical protein|nr:PorT family protein [Candidatus Symbiothrix sp.]